MKLLKKNKNIFVGVVNVLKESLFGIVILVESNGFVGGECSKEFRWNSNDSVLGSCNSMGNFIYFFYFYLFVFLVEYCMFVKNRGYLNIFYVCDFLIFVLIICFCN